MRFSRLYIFNRTGWLAVSIGLACVTIVWLRSGNSMQTQPAVDRFSVISEISKTPVPTQHLFTRVEQAEFGPFSSKGYCLLAFGTTAELFEDWIKNVEVNLGADWTPNYPSNRWCPDNTFPPFFFKDDRVEFIIIESPERKWTVVTFLAVNHRDHSVWFYSAW